MQSLAKELLHSLPIDVEFAGFRGNTLSLAQAGWDLSMQQEIGMYGNYVMRLAMRHSGAQLYAISQTMEFSVGRVNEMARDANSYAQFLASLVFRIQAITSDIRFRIQPERVVGRMSDSFFPIDPWPQARIEEESIRDFKFFKVSNPSIKDIIVSPDQVPELLDLVLNMQKPTMDQIRARERSRANTEWVRENMGSAKPAHHVQAQIITLAS